MKKQKKQKGKRPRKIVGRMRVFCSHCHGQREFPRFDPWSFHGHLFNRLARRLHWRWLEYKRCSKCSGGVR